MANVDIDQFKNLIADGQVQIGDLVLVENGEHGILNFLIRRTQVRLLYDLYGLSLSDRVIRRAARFTHAATVLGSLFMGEMFWPHARSIAWEDRLRPGTRILVRRALDFPGGAIAPFGVRAQIADECRHDILDGTPYPVRELLYYWVVSWGRKLYLGRHFADIFCSRTADVCSGRYWLWCRRAGLFEDAEGGDVRPEAWYPARLAVSDRFTTVGEFLISRRRAPDAAVVGPPSQAEGVVI